MWPSSYFVNFERLNSEIRVIHFNFNLHVRPAPLKERNHHNVDDGTRGAAVGLRTVPYYGYGRKKYGWLHLNLSVTRTVYLIFDLLNGTVREKKRVYGRIYGYYINNWESRSRNSAKITFFHGQESVYASLT